VPLPPVIYSVSPATTPGGKTHVGVTVAATPALRLPPGATAGNL